MATLRGITASEVCLFLGHGGKELTNKTLGQAGIKSGTPLVFLPEYYKNIQKGNYGETPLSIASFSGREDVVRLLLDNGADVNKADKLGTTPLSIASRLGKKHIVEALLKAPDIKVDKSDTFPKETPLFLASQNGHLDVVKALLVEGADVNKENRMEQLLFL